MVILAGAPGTGKTILAQQICFLNATPEHKAVYCTTLSEPHSKIIRHLEPFNFFKADALGVTVEYLHLGELVQDLDGAGLAAVTTEVVRQCTEMHPVVLVIDSAKALRDFATEKELRAALYDLASRVAHTDTVLLLLGEYNTDEIETSSEFSLADGIIQLAYEAHEPVDRRWLRVVKLRGTPHLVGKHSFRIGKTGFEVFPRLETMAHRSDGNISGRITSGVPRLDELMGGGVSGGDATVILGPSGAGKTILGLQFLVEGLREGQRCLHVSLQETGDQLVRKAALFGWDLATARKSGQLQIHHIPVGQLDLDTVAAAVRAHLIHDVPPKRVVVDSLAELVFAARESERFPAYARSLVGVIREAGASLIVTSETSTLGPTTEPVSALSFLFQNVVLLRYIETDSAVLRALNILKMRNSAHDKGIFEFTIDERGFTVGDKLTAVTGVLGWSALRSQGSV